jgi:hypothetical protein
MVHLYDGIMTALFHLMELLKLYIEGSQYNTNQKGKVLKQ